MKKKILLVTTRLEKIKKPRLSTYEYSIGDFWYGPRTVVWHTQKNGVSRKMFHTFEVFLATFLLGYCTVGLWVWCGVVWRRFFRWISNVELQAVPAVYW